jgi:hypothetical protein
MRTRDVGAAVTLTGASRATPCAMSGSPLRMRAAMIGVGFTSTGTRATVLFDSTSTRYRPAESATKRPLRSMRAGSDSAPREAIM